jgi:hypothetical protein
MNELHKQFCKNNKKILTEIFNEKLSTLTEQVFDGKMEERGAKIDAINILRDWIREVEIVSEPNKNKPNSFV